MAVDTRAKDRLIFALDVPRLKDAVHWVKLLDGSVGCFKVGLELFISAGPQVLEAIREYSAASIFLDLKLHDIPATVQKALTSAAAHQVRFVTIHNNEGEQPGDSITAAVRDTALEVLAVTVLTSLDESDLPDLGYRQGLTLKQLVLDRAALAKQAGCAGVVCSGNEVAAVREHCGPDLIIVVPGIRPEWSVVERDDQARITTPGEAIRAGADYLVVGRPIRTAPDPRAAALRVVEEIQSALK